MQYVVSLLPVIVFLVSLYLFDSFRLVRKALLFICLLWGISAAVLAYFLNTYLLENLAVSFTTFSRFIAPLSEEFLKSMLILALLSQRRIGFTIDALIYGFAVGTGFALSENLVYLANAASVDNLLVWIIRGFGTALMHGGTTAMLSIMIMAGLQRNKHFLLSIWPGFFVAYAMHSFHNQFLLDPVLQTFLLLLSLPILFALVFRQSNHMLQNWLEIEFSSEVELLRMIRQGKFRSTKAGDYLASLKDYFAPETIVDLYAYISLYLELSIAAKRNMLLKENGFDVIIEEDTLKNLQELSQLRKQIGKAGELAIQPVVRMRHRELWKLNQLKK